MCDQPNEFSYDFSPIIKELNLYYIAVDSNQWGILYKSNCILSAYEK